MKYLSEVKVGFSNTEEVRIYKNLSFFFQKSGALFFFKRQEKGGVGETYSFKPPVLPIIFILE